MNTTRIATLALSSLLALGFMAPPAFARDGWGDRDRDRHGWNDNDRGRDRDWHDRDRDRDRRWRERERHDDRRYYSQGYRDGYRRRPDVVYYRHPGPPPWARGQRYYGPNYVVYDYDRYQVRRPPYGYRWVRDDRGNLLMVAIASGIIADLVLNGR
ncbi:RcnB family protein [Xanthomonas sp. NCPPB 2654]|uniref:RcnB family protein n=1 Tax=unclassified Xanthomonas TaxID=2643310 RepID=UPI0021E0D7B1|nr:MULTISPECIES: RcnB family protein [unclassified Xanthomonas]MDL5365142.1 RcnB family protein [Xanthomonas sp. NCPPB 2654]MDR6673433.1 Ni/Co efflux regulator RcnB [Xanthomonas translucens]MEB1530311.1 RcnB family protein [Xanthomonas campestris pv. campestris]UYC21565.1 RcnB family protein [Xanthomonas sp. CFBP 8443]